MSELWKNLRYGARMLARSPGFTAIVVLILALGIGANSAIFSIVNAVLLRPLPYHEPERLYQIDEVDPRGNPNGASPADAAVFRQRGHLLESVGVSRWQNLTLTGPEGPENVYGALVSADCFPMLGTKPALGRLFRDDEFKPGAPRVALISDQLWRRRFAASAGVLNRQLMMNGEAYTIIGVMPPGFFFGQRFALWTPWQFTGDQATNRDSRFSVVARLRPGINRDRAQAELEGAYRNIAPEEGRKGWHLRLVPLRDQLTERVRPALVVLLGAVGFVLLIACLNVANLLLARSADRGREIAVRTALGAGRLRVIRQLLTENILLAGIGGMLGLALGAGGARALVALYPERIPVPRLDQSRMDWSVLLFTLGLSVLTGLVFGLVPAFKASRTDLASTLKEGGRSASGGAHSQRLRSALVVAETALSLVLLAGAGLMLRSFARLLSVDTGFNPERVLTLRVPLPLTITKKPDQVAYCTRLLERVQSLPGLNTAGLIAPLPLGDVDANATFAVEGKPAPAGERQLVKLRAVSSGYFRSMGIALRHGRVFADSDTADAPQVVVVNQTLSRQYFPNENPIGRRVSMDTSGKGPWFSIVGVVDDVKYMELRSEPAPEMYRDFRQFLFAPFAIALTLRTSTEDPMRLAAAAQKEIRAVNPDQPISDLRSMRQVVSQSVSQPRLYTVLLGVFAALALLLAAAGLYGVLSYSVSQRVHEIGIRMALGAPGSLIFRQVVGRALVLVAVGIVFGLGGAFALTRLLATQLFQVKPYDPLTFAAVSLLLAAVAAAAGWLPARRATRVDPIVALRCE